MLPHEVKDTETVQEKIAEFNRLSGRFAEVYNNTKGFWVPEILKSLPRAEALTKIQDRIRELEAMIYEPQIEAIALRDLYTESMAKASEEEREYFRKRDAAYKPKARTAENMDARKEKPSAMDQAVAAQMMMAKALGKPMTKDEAIAAVVKAGFQNNEAK
jgi:hypothetical protein